MIKFLMAFLFASVLFTQEKSGISVCIEGETNQINPAHSLLLTLKIASKNQDQIKLPDLRDRVKGFIVAEDFEESQTLSHWRLVPEAYSQEYKIKPFVVGGQWFGPFYFENPPERESVTGPMEVMPKKDFPPLTWGLVGVIMGILSILALVVYLVVIAVKYIARRIKEHRMSPIERAWVELDRLVKKGLPGRGKYKDFYIELTMVVRRYIQRRYGVKAPHMTTEEFLKEYSAIKTTLSDTASLKEFLESADLVKFAGVSATPETADEATLSAKRYLQSDSSRSVGDKS
ncbi:MAG: hypothetical protein J6S51_02785 [Kiritimatiellae bacterium]|nr:hypothetical protein [Kiritimatiellia bacterium]